MTTSPSRTPKWRSTFVRPLHASSCTDLGISPAASELRGDDRLALCLRDRREVVVAGRVEEVDVRVPGLHRLEHRLALCGVVDGAHVRAGDDPRPAAARVHLDDHVDEGEEHRREEVREHLVGRAVETAGERAVEVRARRPEARVRLRGLGRDRRDDDRSGPTPAPGRSPRGAGVRRSGPRTRRRACRPRRAPSARSPFAIVAIGIETNAPSPVPRGSRSSPTCLPLRPRGRSCTRPDGSRPRTSEVAASRRASVASSSRSTSSSVCAYEKWLRFRFSGSSKMPSFIISRR